MAGRSVAKRTAAEHGDAVLPTLRFAHGPGRHPDPTFAWALALGAPLVARDGHALDALTTPGDGKPATLEDGAPDGLQQFWRVEDRAGLIRALTWLGQGGHREPHRASVARYSVLFRPAIAARREELRTDGETNPLAKDEIWRLNAVQSDHNGIRRSAFLAFDAVRAVNLVYAGRARGWLTDAECGRYLLDLARDVQRTYGSWTDYAEDFLRSRAFWAGLDHGEGEIVTRIVRLLQRAERSPWRLPWAQPGLATPRPTLAPEHDGPEWSLERVGDPLRPT